MTEVSSFIDGLREEGTLESSGAFTIDLDRAQEVLGLYLLRDSRQWVLKLVQWAVALGASNVELLLEHNRVRIGHDGEPLDLTSPRPVSSQRAEPAWARKELTAALQVAAQLRPQVISSSRPPLPTSPMLSS